MVSIIVPFHNTQRDFFTRCLNSIQNQNYSNCEIIVIDDGSSQEYADDLNRIKQIYTNICVISTEANGVSSARNTGIKYARGEYITFIDSDDVISPDAISKAVELCQTHNLDMLIGRMKKMLPNEIEFDRNDKKMIMHIYNSAEERKIVSQSVFERKICADLCKNGWEISFQAPVARLIRKECCCLFPEGIAISEDTIWNYFTFQQNIKIGICNIDWYAYVLNSSSTLHTYSDDYIKKISDAVIYFNNNLDLHTKKSKEYLFWIYTKLRQIQEAVFSQTGSLIITVKSLRAVSRSTAFAEVLTVRKRRFADIIKVLLFKSGMSIIYYVFKNKIVRLGRRSNED